MIKPTIGRVVLVRNRSGKIGVQDEAALVTYVHGDTCINVGGFDANGNHFAATSVPLHHGDDADAPAWLHAAWMPFQKGQAAKTEALEKQVAGKVA